MLGCGNESVAFELQGKVFAPLYDHAGHVISLLDAKNGAVYETYRYSAFGQEQVFDADSQETTSSINPWRYAGKRTDQETGFVYYGMRYYDPQTCRWLTPDPAGFVDGLNLYAFLLNNPLRYSDLDGRFAIAIPLLSLIFGFEFTVSITTLGAIVNALLVTSLFIAGTQAEGWMNDTAMNQEALAEEEEKAEKKGRRRGKDNEIKGGPPRDKKTGNYLPDEAAEGSPHTTLGDRDSARGSYRQGATFDQDGNFRGRTDHTDHGRGDHPNPHYHPATGPNGTKPGPHPLPDFI